MTIYDNDISTQGGTESKGMCADLHNGRGSCRMKDAHSNPGDGHRSMMSVIGIRSGLQKLKRRRAAAGHDLTNIDRGKYKTKADT